MVLVKYMGPHPLAEEEAVPKRRVRDDLDSELARRLEQRGLLVLNVERNGRMFDLDCRDGVHGVCAAKGFGADLREPKVLDLTRPAVRSR